MGFLHTQTRTTHTSIPYPFTLHISDTATRPEQIGHRTQTRATNIRAKRSFIIYQWYLSYTYLCIVVFVVSVSQILVKRTNRGVYVMLYVGSNAVAVPSYCILALMSSLSSFFHGSGDIHTHTGNQLRILR